MSISTRINYWMFHMIKNALFLTGLLVIPILATPSLSASWNSLETHSFQDWDATYNEYTSRNGRFCAAETSNPSGDVFRMNFFRDGSTHFLEIFNSNWSFFEGNVDFTLSFDSGYTVELKGRSWGDSFTYDFIDQDKTFAIFSIFSKATTVDVLNSNNGILGTFSLLGSEPALRKLVQCFSSSE